MGPAGVAEWFCLRLRTEKKWLYFTFSDLDGTKRISDIITYYDMPKWGPGMWYSLSDYRRMGNVEYPAHIAEVTYGDEGSRIVRRETMVLENAEFRYSPPKVTYKLTVPWGTLISDSQVFEPSPEPDGGYSVRCFTWDPVSLGSMGIRKLGFPLPTPLIQNPKVIVPNPGPL